MDKAEQVFSAKARVEGGKEVKALTVSFFLWLISSITITVATGVYLWAKDDDKQCFAPNANNDRTLQNINAWVDVSRRFRDVLKIFFAVAITDVFRSALMIVAVLKKSGALATLYQALVINDVLGFGAIFVLHAFRFSLSGKICSGDYEDQGTASYPHTGQLLKDQGRYLIGLVCWVWIGGILLCTMSTCIMLYSYKPLFCGIFAKIVGAWKKVSLIHRLEQGNQKDLLNIQFIYQMLQSLAIFVAVASFLWTKEVDYTCDAPQYSVEPTGTVNVAKRFRDILKIWWAYGVTDFFRSIIALIAISVNSKKLAWIYQVLILNDFLLVAAVIILHIYRFQYSGQWCSGDFLDDDTYSRPGYLILRGKILVGLVIACWMGLLVYTCLLAGLITAANRRGSGHVRQVKASEDEESKKDK